MGKRELDGLPEARKIALGRNFAKGYRKNPEKTKNLLDSLATEKFKEIGVFCTCATGPRDNLLLWGYYANSHKGVCMEFDVQQEESDLFKKGASVEYVPSYPVLDWFDNQYVIFNRVFIKSQHWAHEKEIRYFHEKCGIYPFTPKVLVSIYFGISINEKARRGILDLLNVPIYSHVKKYACKKHPKDFSLTFERL